MFAIKPAREAYMSGLLVDHLVRSILFTITAERCSIKLPYDQLLFRVKIRMVCFQT